MHHKIPTKFALIIFIFIAIICCKKDDLVTNTSSKILLKQTT